jgi:DNA-binding transcriptional LysR family regulator
VRSPDCSSLCVAEWCSCRINQSPAGFCRPSVNRRTGFVELGNAGLIALEDTVRFSGYLRELDIPVDPADFRLVANSSVVVWEMVKRGMGVAPMLREIADRTPGVTRILLDVPPISVPIWLVTHAELQSSPRIRLVQEILAEELARL